MDTCYERLGMLYAQRLQGNGWNLADYGLNPALVRNRRLFQTRTMHLTIQIILAVHPVVLEIRSGDGIQGEVHIFVRCKKHIWNGRSKRMISTDGA
jgi:hypothetical protein